MDVICILGNQLFEPKHLPLRPSADVCVFMREDRELCTRFRYHKHKIIFFLAAMRTYATELRAAGYQVHYEELDHLDGAFVPRLLDFATRSRCRRLHMFEIEDAFFEDRITSALAAFEDVALVFAKTPMFLTSREQFSRYLRSTKRPFMKTFYEAQRKNHRILVDGALQPEGGRWSFDDENRQALPKGHVSPPLPSYGATAIDDDVMALVAREFSSHPGDVREYWLPTSRLGARSWARDFFDKRFELFGPYEDALAQDQPFLYHSILTPYLNTGLITPQECVTVALHEMRTKQIPINSVEGFIRQIIGWREFIRGIYQNFHHEQEQTNHFGASGRLTDAWYRGDSGVEPLDDVIKKTIKYGYAHHIERLMVVGSMMVLLGVAPAEGHRWFMEMFVDSSDWVMGPNVYGMALFSDGGIFATKPYICGSNYYRKMGYKAGAWCDGVDGLYWSFISTHKDELARNPRTSMMVQALARVPADRMKHLVAEANLLRSRLVVS